jgi:hypothetical protein
MFRGATQYRVKTVLLNVLEGAGILAFGLSSAGAIGFPDVFLISSSSAIQGIAISSTLIFIAASGFLITTTPHPLKTAALVGAIAMIGAAIVAGCSLIAPGIQLAVTAGLAYASAWISVPFGFYFFISSKLVATKLPQSSTYKRFLLSKPIIWFGLGLLSFLWLEITLFKLYGLGTAFLFLAVLLIPGYVWLSFTFITQNLKQVFAYSWFDGLETTLSSICLLVVISIVSGYILTQRGAIVWTLENLILFFAVLTAFLLSFCVNQSPDRHVKQINVSNYFSSSKWLSILLLILAVGLGWWGYSRYFWGGVTPYERLSSLGSATVLERILVTQLETREITISPDEQFLASSGENPFKNQEATVQLWNLETGKLTHTFPGYSTPVFANPSSSQPTLLMHNREGQVERWNLTNLQHEQGNDQDKKLLKQQTQLLEIPLPSFLPDNAEFLASSSDGKILVTAFHRSGLYNRMLVWDTQSKKLLYSLSPGSPFIPIKGYRSYVVLSPSGHLLANDPSDMAITEGILHIWRLSPRV